jgi:hypothetical protein
VRHCYTEQTVQFDRLKQSKQALEEEKVEVEGSCRRLEEELDAASQRGREKDQAHATALTNIQMAKRELQETLDSTYNFVVIAICLSLRSAAFNSHLSYATSLFLVFCSTFPIKMICPKRPSVLYGH